MHTVDQLKTDHRLAKYAECIRRHKIFARCAVIATSAEAQRCLVATSAIEQSIALSEDVDYHIVHIYGISPVDFRDMEDLPQHLEEVEIRCQSWNSLMRVVASFCEGADIEDLIETSRW